ncbi:MAG: glycosyltransferase family 1 protein [Candidatus Omnitrophica bacterium]|nr:glycosyltransferase family 1 protein [Candidatus Omnitrophota bacterium]
MKIAVISTKGKMEGGAFQYSLSLSRLLKENNSEKYNFIFFTTVKENVRLFAKYGPTFNYLRWSNIDRFKNLLFSSQILSGVLAKFRISPESRIDRILKKHNIDLVYFLNPSDLALAVSRLNYIFTIWDLCFLDFMEFPEVYANREFERRNSLYRFALPKAVKVIADSEFTKRNIIKKYCLDEARVVSLPLLSSVGINVVEQENHAGYINIRKKYNINGKYIFYPAQFWPHKNHIYILEGLKLLKEKYEMIIHVIFAGSDKGNLSFILRKAEEFGIADQIHYVGFVGDNELPYLYTQALALVMPTYFGPTNLPPLEAFKLGCPVLYSDLPGLNEQVKDAALLLDLNNPESLCKGLLKVLNDTASIDTLIKNGKKKIEALENENYWRILKDAFDDYSQKMKCWK